MDCNDLILGAGPAGMSASSRLIRSNVDFSIIEKEYLIGSLAKTIQYGLFPLDIGPHIMCIKSHVDEIAIEIIKEPGGDSA
jgi:protoporphyrinogen oxidase